MQYFLILFWFCEKQFSWNLTSLLPVLELLEPFFVVVVVWHFWIEGLDKKMK